jgi:hypothetical protein
MMVLQCIFQPEHQEVNTPNARCQPPLEAGATQERTL